MKKINKDLHNQLLSHSVEGKVSIEDSFIEGITNTSHEAKIIGNFKSQN